MYEYITSEDGNSYYFDSRSLNDEKNMIKYKRNDLVEFNSKPPSKGKGYGKADSIISLQGDCDEFAENSLDSVEDANAAENDKIVSNRFNKKSDEIIKYFHKGFAHHIIDQSSRYQLAIIKGFL